MLQPVLDQNLDEVRDCTMLQVHLQSLASLYLTCLRCTSMYGFHCSTPELNFLWISAMYVDIVKYFERSFFTSQQR